MNVISFAQNFEDVMLWRALRDVSHGFYVDVGANDPVIDSVTRWFYTQGWHGINIEPVPHWHQLLQSDRPLDINLQMAVSTTTGRLTLYDVPETGLSTLNPDVAKLHELGGSEVRPITVPATPLDSVLAQYAGDRDIHFLKIDVEGAERDVLQSMDLKRFRPWIILVEATAPRIPEPNHHLWEELLTNCGYQFAYFDGLNRFYVADEHFDLAQALKVPPNTFDNFMRYAEWQARTALQTLTQQADELRQQWSQSQSQIEHLQVENARLCQERVQILDQHGKLDQDYHLLLDQHGELDQACRFQQVAHRNLENELKARQRQLGDMEQSVSWRITEPLRVVRRKLRRSPSSTAEVVLPSGDDTTGITPATVATPETVAAPCPQNPAHPMPAESTVKTADLLLHQIAVQWFLVDRMDHQREPPEEICCELCGHIGQATAFAVIDAQCRFGGGSLRRYQCPHCDVIFGPLKMLRLSPEELSQEYDWHYRVFSEGDSTEQEIRAFESLAPQPGGTYLNYGVGAWSSSVQRLRSRGWNIVAYEPTGSAQAQPGLVTKREDLAEMRFDGIYSNNVLEHLRHPADDLRFLAGLLRPGARMSHATPCYEYLYEYTRFHLFFYLGRSRQVLADQAGLSISSFEQDGLYMNTVYESIELQGP